MLSRSLSAPVAELEQRGQLLLDFVLPALSLSLCSRLRLLGVGLGLHLKEAVIAASTSASAVVGLPATADTGLAP